MVSRVRVRERACACASYIYLDKGSENDLRREVSYISKRTVSDILSMLLCREVVFQ